MNFVHPEFLYLAPLVAAPLIIHLLNRIRYRRMRWAAIDFLLASEQRAVRRAQLRQIILMCLRMLLLAAVLGALAQPILSGSLAGLLGGNRRTVILLDASATMSASDADGSAFDRGRRLAESTITALPRTAEVSFATFSARYRSQFREPLLDHQVVASAVKGAALTAEGADVPLAISRAAESLARSGGGGLIWIITDLHRSSWQDSSDAAWAGVRQALDQAGKPRLVITDLAPEVETSFAVVALKTSPELLSEGDTPRLTVSVARKAGRAATTQAGLYFDDRLIDTATVEFRDSNRTDVVFHLPALAQGVHSGYVELQRDNVPANDRYYFILHPVAAVPVLLVDGEPATRLFEGASNLIRAALQPSDNGGRETARSPYHVKVVTTTELARTRLDDFAGIFLADVPALDAGTAEALRRYVTSGGLLMVFPGVHTSAASWREAALPGLKFGELVEAKAGQPFKVAWASAASPITRDVPAGDLGRTFVQRYLQLAPAPEAETLVTLDDGRPLLRQCQSGRGRIYAWAVSPLLESSNVPESSLFPLVLWQALAGHLAESGEALAHAAGTRLRLPGAGQKSQVVLPGGRTAPVTVDPEHPEEIQFDETDQAGIYRLAAGPGPEAAKEAPIVAAFNPPAEETDLARLEPERIRDLLSGCDLHFSSAAGDVEMTGTSAADSRAGSTFPLAVLGVLLLLGEIVMAWWLGRPVKSRAG